MDHARHNALPSQTTFDVGTTLKYQCHSGYVTNGFPTAKCLAMGGSASWFGPDISCEREYHEMRSAVRAGPPAPRLS